MHGEMVNYVDPDQTPPIWEQSDLGHHLCLSISVTKCGD